MKEYGPCFFCCTEVIEGDRGVSWIKTEEDLEKIFFHDVCISEYVRSVSSGKESENRTDH